MEKAVALGRWFVFFRNRELVCFWYLYNKLKVVSNTSLRSDIPERLITHVVSAATMEVGLDGHHQQINEDPDFHRIF